MTFTPKNWQDSPSIATPIDSDSLTDLETRVTDYTDASAVNAVSDASGHGTADFAVIKEAPLNVEWAEYGASPGASDNTTAINAAFAALPTRSFNSGTVAYGTILFPRFGYKCASQLNLDSTIGAVLQGMGENTDPSYYGTSVDSAALIYTGSGTTPFISARSSQGLTIDRLPIVYSGAFTGNLIDFSHAPTGPLGGGSPFDAANMTIRDSFIGGFNVNGARCLISLKNALMARVENVIFNHASQAIRCREEDPSTHVVAYSNVHTFEDCYFGNDLVSAIVNAGEGLRVTGAVCEAGSTLKNLYTDDLDSSASIQQAYGLSFDDCGFFDVTAGNAVVMLNFGAHCNYFGVSVKGGFWSGNAVTGDAFMRFAASASGVSVKGAAVADLVNGVDLGAQSASNTHQGFVIDGSALSAQTVTNPVVNRNGHQGVRIIGVQPSSQEHFGFQQLRSELNSGAPVLAAQAGAGSTGTVGFLDTGATDTAGLVHVNPGGTGISANALVKLTYANAYPAAPSLSGAIPKVVLEPANAAAAALQAYVDRTLSDNTKFTLASANAPTTGVQYEWHYHVIQ